MAEVLHPSGTHLQPALISLSTLIMRPVNLAGLVDFNMRMFIVTEQRTIACKINYTNATMYTAARHTMLICSTDWYTTQVLISI